MYVRSATLTCFSPTGTSKAVLQAIGQGLGLHATELLDATPKAVRQKALQLPEEQLLVLALPVYKGRLPEVLRDWLGAMSLANTPVVCVVVYGNRDFEDALVELHDVVKERGGIPVACGAFIGEHSYSADDTPIGVARPDAEDLRKAEAFGRKAVELLPSLAAPSIHVPGNRPYHEPGGGAPVDFIGVTEACTQCGECAVICPEEAIPAMHPGTTDITRCIRCCACIKTCPEQARFMKEGGLKDIARRLSANCRARKEPEMYFPE